MWTGYTFYIPIKSKSASDVIRAYIHHVNAMFGEPIKILSDSGTEFKNELLATTAEHLDVTT